MRGPLAIWCAISMLGVGGCVRDDLVPCANGRACPVGRLCDTMRDTCVMPGEPRCGDGLLSPDTGEACDEGMLNADTPDAACRPTCQLPRCGDGIVDVAGGEVCDDANLVSGDGCRPDCRSTELCGNSQLDVVLGEECDDGNRRGLDGCDAACALERPRWVQATTPKGFSGARATYDARRDTSVLWAGTSTWERRGLGWRTTASATATPALPRAGLVYDHARGVSVLLGSNQTWTWDGDRWRQLLGAQPPSAVYPELAYDSARRVVIAASQAQAWELPASGPWAAITPPVPRVNAMIAYDPMRGRTVLHGGLWASGMSPIYRDDTLAWDGTSWTVVGTGHASYDAMTAWDAGRELMVSTGGSGGSDETFALIGAAWTTSAGPRHDPRSSAAIAHDPIRGRTLLFGGDTVIEIGTADTWERDATGWTQIILNSPGLRDGAAAAYDEARGVVWMFGGSGDPSLWAWDAERWVKHPAAGPGPRSFAVMAFDRGRGRTVLFGGESGSTKLGDTWQWDGSAWTPGPIGPAPRSHHAVAYDAARGHTVVFGGETDTGVDAETWVFDGAWSQRTPTASPSPRSAGALAYDEHRQRVVLFGGRSQGGGALRDTWEWDGVTWTEVVAPTSPQASEGHALTYDRDRQRVVLRRKVGDLWEWDGQVWQQIDTFNVGPIWPQATHAVMLHHAAARETLTFGQGETWLVGYTSPVTEVCTVDRDRDGDGLRGCADDDCWGRCTPACAPGLPGCVSAARCGDGTCSQLEICQSCAVDCGPCPARCGDFACTPPESIATCPGDCS